MMACFLYLGHLALADDFWPIGTIQQWNVQNNVNSIRNMFQLRGIMYRQTSLPYYRQGCTNLHRKQSNKEWCTLML